MGYFAFGESALGRVPVLHSLRSVSALNFLRATAATYVLLEQDRVTCFVFDFRLLLAVDDVSSDQ